jgi:hypothetical protein
VLQSASQRERCSRPGTGKIFVSDGQWGQPSLLRISYRKPPEWSSPLFRWWSCYFTTRCWAQWQPAVESVRLLWGEIEPWAVCACVRGHINRFSRSLLWMLSLQDTPQTCFVMPCNHNDMADARTCEMETPAAPRCGAVEMTRVDGGW